MSLEALKFTSLEEVRAYLSGDRIACLVCGKLARRLQYKHLEMHGLDADGYRERFGIPWSFSLTSAPSREASRRMITEANTRHLTRRDSARRQVRRPSCPAVANQWARDAELGWNASARLRVTTHCAGGCGTSIETTMLTACQPVHCDRCASPAALRLRRRK